MLFREPDLGDAELAVLRRIDALKGELRYFVAEPRRWQESLRRLTLARNIRGSNTIEGYDARLDDAAAVAMGEEPLDADAETRLALRGYREATTWIVQLAQEAGTAASVDLVRGLHFMMTSYDLRVRPGRWRAGPVYVRDERADRVVHEGADVAAVPALMGELVDRMNARTSPAVVRAAMTHLDLVMIHPFRDGNGRMGRALQSFVLAAEGASSPVFMSLEEYLGRNTQEYYDVLARVGGGRWQPHGDARPWLRFALTAHLRQALTVRRRIRESERLWDQLERLVLAQRVPDRAVTVLFDAALGLRVRNATYRASLAEHGEDIMDATAGRDLRALVDADLLMPKGEKRGRHYVASSRVRQIYERMVSERDPLDMADPFACAAATRPSDGDTRIPDQ